MRRILLMMLAASTPTLAAQYAIDEAHTSVHFSVSHFERSNVRGRWLRVAGKVAFDVTAKTGEIDLAIKAEEIDTGLKVLDGVLTSSQILDVERYPTIRFRSTGFTFGDGKLRAVDGLLTLHGETRPLQLVAKRFQCGEVTLLGLRRQVCGGEYHATLHRSDFGMTRFLPEVGDEVRLDIAVEASPID